MASIAQLLCPTPVLPLDNSKHNKDHDTVLIEIHHTTPAGQVIRLRDKLPYVDSYNDVKLIIKTIIEFNDACDATRLNITTGPNMFTYFRRCLGGGLRDTWDNFGMARTVVVQHILLFSIEPLVLLSMDVICILTFPW